MSIEIRHATADDLATLTGFNQHMAMETEGRHLDQDTIAAGVRAVLTDADKGFYLIAEEEGKAAGCLMVTREWSDWRNYWFWWIQSVYVDARYRRQGIYQSLYHHVQAMAAAGDDIGGFRLYVDTENTRAQKTYERLGMRRCNYLVYEGH